MTTANSTSTSASASTSSPRPIILVTGANAGLGFATCQRLLLQLSTPTPSDTLPFSPGLRPSDAEPLPTPFTAPRGCTLIMACRNPIKAHKARRALVGLIERIKHLPDHTETPTSASVVEKLSVGPPVSAKSTVLQQEPDEVIAQGQEEETIEMNKDAQDGKEGDRKSTILRHRKQREQEEEAEEEAAAAPLLQDDVETRNAKARGKYRRRFCRGTKIEFVALDLGSMASVLTCAKQVQERYPYLTHLIHNAGGGAFTGLDWFAATWMIMTSFRAAVTYPKYKIQRSGDLSQDGLGWVWQINVGSSWALTQALLPHMRKTPYSTPSRIIFTSSIEAWQKYYISEDFQCLNTDVRVSRPYESTKFQCELAAHALARQLAEDKDPHTPQVYLTHPGVVATSIMADFLNVFTSFAMLAAFYLARWVLSPHHCVEPYKGSISHCFASLAPRESLSRSTRYGSRCDFWGREYVHYGRTDGWDEQDDNTETGDGNITRLAIDWARKANAVVKKIRRDSDAGVLPPSGPLKEELLRGVAENGDKDDWEKVDSAV